MSCRGGCIGIRRRRIEGLEGFSISFLFVSVWSGRAGKRSEGGFIGAGGLLLGPWLIA